MFMTIHHPDLKLETTVAVGAFPALAKKGWKKGPLKAPESKTKDGDK